MQTIEHSVIIQKPVTTVFSFIEDLSRRPEWEVGVLETSLVSGNSYGEGATIQIISSVMGKRIETTAEVVQFVPNQIVSCKAMAPFPHVVENLYEDLGGGQTRFTRRATGDPDAATGIFKFGKSFLMNALSRQLKQTCESAKKVLENQPT
ncbi:SRPBCC family protein [Alicyclobacillus tolerans]|uniref:SRPBCC family protein n=1 Tax=Alicyclobacillus tolerans TaxID=90970 RepID=UPI001F1C61C6|nr:SRPBCC family protein [Alicyclobacillus tolerans]MCF8564100.1 SRPBCC family protein [Alicyclobacillus tolerans]